MLRRKLSLGLIGFKIPKFLNVGSSNNGLLTNGFLDHGFSIDHRSNRVQKKSILRWTNLGSVTSNACAGLLLSLTAMAEPPIIQPGAPGQPHKILDAAEASAIAVSSFSPDDTRFLQDMIVHHQQAVDMANLVNERTNQPSFIDVAGRIKASQIDEITFMESWLDDREQSHVREMDHSDMSTHHAAMGMASPEQMRALADASSLEFETLFLELMINHHDGALEMTKNLLELPGSAHDPALYQFITDLKNEQTAEIDRMDLLRAGLSPDPRANLPAGFPTGGEAALNMRLVVNLPKPPGFFDPENPSELPPLAPKEDQPEEVSWWSRWAASLPFMSTDGASEVQEQTESHTEKHKPADSGTLSHREKPEPRSKRSPLLSFSYTDMAFSGDLLALGGYHGFNLYRLNPSAPPNLLSSVVCPGGQGDVSIVGDLLLMSVEENRGRIDCGLGGIADDISSERFRGLRIFDISDLTEPKQVGLVQTCRGSHTHSVVRSNEDTIIVYNSGTSNIRKEEELAGCIGATPGDNRTALFRIDVIEIPVADPSKAKIVDSPAVFADPETGALAGLWRGGEHDDESQTTSRTDQCHDITVYPTGGIAAGACSGNGIIFDITHPLTPSRLDVVTDTGFAYWHSATFNNDGTKVLFTDEWGGGMRPRCRSFDPIDWGAIAIFDIADHKLDFQSYYKMPAPQTKTENCVAHNGSIVPIPGRDIFVQAWYQGGISVIDFTDSKNPIEIAYFDRGPIHETQLVLGGFWSTYWYQGQIYATEITRGLDVLELLPSEFLTANEIAAAALADPGETFNPQQQFPVRWPDSPLVARAYIDQLRRDQVLSEEDLMMLETFATALEDGFAPDHLAQLNQTLSQLEQRAHQKKVQHRSLSGVLQVFQRSKKETL